MKRKISMYDPYAYHKFCRGATKSPNYGEQALQVAKRDLEITRALSRVYGRDPASRPRVRQYLRENTVLFSTLPFGPLDFEADN